MDIALTQAINSLAGNHPILDRAMIAIADYGKFVLVFAVVLLWWRRDQRLQARHACVVAGLACVMSLASNEFLRLFIHRIRPYDAGITHLWITPNPDWSFPSGHAVASIAIVAALWFKGLTRIASVLSVLVALICFSRIYLGLHYVTDILGGVLVGALVAFILAKLYQDDSWYAQRITNIF